MFYYVTVRFVQLLTTLAAICFASSLFGLEGQLHVGDRIVTIDQASIVQPGQTPVPLPARTEGTVTAVRDNWVGVVIQQGNKRIAGWIQVKHLARAAVAPPTQAETPAKSAVPPDSLSPSQALSDDIRRKVVALGYSDTIARDFTTMVGDWNLVALKEEVRRTHERFQRKELSASQVAGVEAMAVKQLCQEVGKSIRPFMGVHTPLGEIVKHKSTNPVGYAQVVYVLANCIGLPTVVVDTHAVVKDQESSVKREFPFPTCLTKLTDGRVILADVLMHSLGQQPVTPFVFSDNYRQDGSYWELKNKGNSLLLGRLQLLNGRGLVSVVYVSLGIEHASRAEYRKAEALFTKAIELNPKHARAYLCRSLSCLEQSSDPQGLIVEKQGETIALGDMAKAIELDPKYSYAYICRARLKASVSKKQFAEAIADFSRVIEFDQDSAEAYEGRGSAFLHLERYDETIADCTKAIKLKPRCFNAYLARGCAHINLNRNVEGVQDFTKAIELQPTGAIAYALRGRAELALGKKEEGVRDLHKAVELDPSNKETVEGFLREYKK